MDEMDAADFELDGGRLTVGDDIESRHLISAVVQIEDGFPPLL